MDQIIIANNAIETLVAITEEDHETGLMYKPWPTPIMTFPYDKAEIRKFWMKNCYSPLDIIFCRQGQIVAIHSGEPLSERFIGPDEPTDLVVEMPRGMAKALAVQPGQRVLLKRSIYTIAASYVDSLRKMLNK